MREFTKDRYGVDVMKVEIPINMKYVEGTKCFKGQKAYTKQDAMKLFLDAAAVATKPFIFLSAGVSNAEFTESLELAAESGVKFNGVLVRTRHLERWYPHLCETRRRRLSGSGWKRKESRTSTT
jgi:tagatose 1,6-diphosphate aldolase